jgi:heme/copper-type cytochrome/quinol oxidase subunit 4
MKAVYTILFLLDTVALILFAYFLLKLSNKEANETTFIALLCAVIACIILLVYIILRFINSPRPANRR